MVEPCGSMRCVDSEMCSQMKVGNPCRMIDILVAYIMINTRLTMALWRLIADGFVFVAIETFNQIFKVGITNTNLIFGHLNKEHNMYKIFLFNNIINHEYNYLPIRK